MRLPPELGIRFFERGWLSSNNILIQGDGRNCLVDSGYCTHSEQTLALVARSLDGKPLDLLLNTHLHSDHCGGNAALQATYPRLETLIPPGLAAAVAQWKSDALMLEATGQLCPRFKYQQLLVPGTEVRLGAWEWQIHAAKGHDPHAVLLYQADHKVLISADALWENGFGVVFPELEGVDAFDEVRDTLDLIEALKPATVIPGHGGVFQDVPEALQRARARLQHFVQNPEAHHRYAIKVLVKFKLLEWQATTFGELLEWCKKTPYMARAMHDDQRAAPDFAPWLSQLLEQLAKSKALQLDGQTIRNL